MLANGSGEANPRFVTPRFSHLDLAQTVLHQAILTDTQRALIKGGTHNTLAPDTGMRRLLYTSALRSIVLERKGRTEEANELARQMNRRLAMLNNMEHAWTSSQNTRLALHLPQDGVRNAVHDFLRSHPKDNQHPNATPDAIHGLTIVAPNTPGIHAALGRIIADCGIGTQPNPYDTQPLTAAIIVPGHEQQDQIAGLTRSREFARLHTMPPTRYQKDQAQGPVLVVTEEKFMRDFKNGRLGAVCVDLLVVTDAHHLTGQRLRDTIRSNWNGPLIGTTATPSYNTQRDVRRVLSHTFEHGDLLSYTENGLLNGAQLLTIPVEPKDYAHQLPEEVDLDDPIVRNLYGSEFVSHAAVDVAMAQIKQGKRGIIVCEPGAESDQARQVAEMLAEYSVPVESESPVGDEYSEPETEPVKAHVLSSYNTPEDNQKARTLFKAGKIQVLTTAGMGKDAVDLGEVHFIIFAVPNGINSRVKLEQFMRHGTPYNEAHPCTVYVEIFMPRTEHDDSIASIWDAYRQHTIHQGMRIMPKITQKDTTQATAPSGSIRQPDALEPPSQPIDSPAASAMRFSRPESAPEHPLDLSDLPHYLQHSIRGVDTRPLREVIIGQKEMPLPPEYSFKLSSWLAGQNIPEKWAVHRLERAGFDYKARRETITEGELEGERVTAHYFKPAAQEWLIQHPMPPRATNDFTSENQLCKRANAPLSVVRRLARAATLQRFTLLNNQNMDTSYYTNNDAAILERAIAALPIARTTDRTPLTLTKELQNSKAFVLRMRLTHPTPTILMRNADGNGFDEYLPRSETQRIKTEWLTYPVADPTDYSIYRMSREANMSRRAFKARLTPEDYATGQIKRSSSGAILHFSSAVARTLIEKAKFDVLPYHLIPIRAVASTSTKPRYVGTTDTTIKNNYANRITNLRLPGTASTGCIDWSTLELLEQKYGRLAGPAIRYKDLPTGPDDTDETHRRYAREVQRRLALAAHMLNAEDPWDVQPQPTAPAPTPPNTPAETAANPPQNAEAPAPPPENTPPDATATPPDSTVLSSTNQAAQTSYRDKPVHPLTRRLNETGIVKLRAMLQQGGHYRDIQRTERRASTPQIDHLAAPQTPQAFTALQIATKAKVDYEEVITAINTLKDEFKAPNPTKVEGVVQVRYGGAYLEAILTEVVGLTPEAIARRAGMSELSKVVTSYLKTKHAPHPKRRGRYTRRALLATIAAFNPPDDYIPLATAMRIHNQTQEALVEASKRLRLPIRHYYNERGEEPYVHVSVTGAHLHPGSLEK